MDSLGITPSRALLFANDKEVIAVFDRHYSSSGEILHAGGSSSCLVLALFNHGSREEGTIGFDDGQAISGPFEHRLERGGWKLDRVRVAFAMRPNGRIGDEQRAPLWQEAMRFGEATAEVVTFEVHEGERAYNAIIVPLIESEIGKRRKIRLEKTSITTGKQLSI